MRTFGLLLACFSYSSTAQPPNDNFILWNAAIDECTPDIQFWSDDYWIAGAFIVGGLPITVQYANISFERTTAHVEDLTVAIRNDNGMTPGSRNATAAAGTAVVTQAFDLHEIVQVEFIPPAVLDAGETYWLSYGTRSVS
jgi:hypothetical protein